MRRFASLRASLEAAGIIGPNREWPMRLISGPCKTCGVEQHVLVRDGAEAKCIACRQTLG